MYLILIFGLLGLLVGGFRGLLVGLVLGYLARGWLQRHGQQNLGQVQAQFLDSTFAVMGALCKADNIVTRDEIEAAEAIFKQHELSSDIRTTEYAASTLGTSLDF